MSEAVERPAALIFRKRLLPWSETFIAAQGKALARYRPVFVGYKYRQAGASYLAGEDCVVLREHALLPALSKGILKALGRVTPRWRRALAERRPAVVHAHFGFNAPDAIPIADSLDLPLVVTYHGMDIAVERESRGERRQRQRVFARAARLVAVSGFIADRLREAGAPEQKLVIHHIGVDTTRFRPGAPDDAPALSILFVGRLVPKKGLIHLLEAMPRIQEVAPGVELLVAGDGPLRGELEEAARRLGARARFLGRQSPEEVAELMRRATVMCTPSVVAPDGNAEGLPMTVVEAQASGLPIVAFPSGGTAEGIVHGETGFVAPPRDEAALAGHLLELLTDPDLRRRFSRAARRHVEASFDLRRQTAKLEEIYDAARAAHAEESGRGGAP